MSIPARSKKFCWSIRVSQRRPWWARPDAEWGEVVVAFIVGAVEPAALDAHLLERIARFKRPKRYLFVDALPKNSYGKVLKRELRNALDLGTLKP